MRLTVPLTIVPALMASAAAGAAILIGPDRVARIATLPFRLPTELVALLVGAPVLF